jgi:hypothetical protein
MPVNPFAGFLSRRPQPRAWARDLAVVIHDLESLNQATEKDFLAVGGKLLEFLNSSRELHSKLEDLALMVSGDRTRELSGVLHGVQAFMKETQDRCAQSANELSSLRQSAALIHRGFSSFGKIAMSFHIAAILARIETSSLSVSQQDLTNLAAQVRTCSDSIEERARQVLDAVTAFSTRLRDLLRESTRLDELQSREIPALLDEVGRDLAAIEHRRQQASAASTELGAKMAAVSRHLGELVTSIQFQDITRQQFEHIIEALRELFEKSHQRTVPTSSGSFLVVQKAQLANSAASFNRSSGKIESDLALIESKVAEMAAASRTILGEDEEQDSFLVKLPQRLTAVFSAVGELKELERDQARASSDLESIARQLKDSIGQVQVIEVQLSRIAINAAVSACHLGAPGDPLNVVAGAIQELQNQCAARSREAGTALISIDCAVETLASLHRAAQGSSLGADTLDGHAANLSATSEASSTAVSSIAALATGLCGGLREVRENFRIRALFAVTANRCVEGLERVSSQLPQHPSNGDEVAGDPNELHARRYTMQSERDVHRAAAAGESAQEPAGTIEEEVEFF